MIPVNMLMYQALRNRDFRVQHKILRDASDPFSLPEIRFKELFRLNHDMVRYLFQSLTPHMRVSMKSNSITPELRIFAALSFFATGSYQRSMGQSYLLSMSQQAAGRAIREISALIYHHMCGIWIKFPSTNEEKLILKRRFHEKTGFPGTIAAVDGTHVAILKPSIEEHNYLNRKGYHSKNVQIVCDYDLRILSINSRYAGASHDSFIWRNSCVREALERNYLEGDQNTWVLGDSGYPQEPWLMTPILNAQPGSPEERYTIAHIRARNCIERCNGVLKGRFRCLLGERKLRYLPEDVGTIIVACAVLHNICVAGRLEENNIDMPVIDDILLHHDFVNIANPGILGEARRIRQTIVQNYFTN